SATRKRICDLFWPGVLDQSANALSAAATARSTSSFPLSATCEYGLPVAGSILSKSLPPIGSTNSPLMKFLILGNSFCTCSTRLNAERSTSNAEHPKQKFFGSVSQASACLFNWQCGSHRRLAQTAATSAVLLYN